MAVWLKRNDRRLSQNVASRLDECHVNEMIELVRYIAVNGSSQYRPRCCANHRPVTYSIKHSVLTQEERVNALRMESRDYSLPPEDHEESHRAPNSPCADCGAPETELHHWAPRALFGDEADQWPTTNLCSRCHARWHQMLKIRGTPP